MGIFSKLKSATLFNEIRNYAKSNNMRFMDHHLMYANLLNQEQRETHKNFALVEDLIGGIDSDGQNMVSELLKRIKN